MPVRQGGLRISVTTAHQPAARPRVAAVLALLNAAVPEKRSFACRLPLFVRPLYREAELGPRAAAYRAAHPEPASADAAP